MKVLIACEFSGVVRRAFRDAGHDAWSCDLLPAEDGSPYHIQGDAIEAAYGQHWDMMIAHPECTHLTLAGARWFYDPRFPNKAEDRERAIEFFKKLMAAPIKYKAVENPQPLQYVMDRIGRYSQKVQPWQFGDDETKGICLWLVNLPPLEPTHTVKPKNIKARVWKMPPGPNRKRERSRFFPGAAAAMAKQWGYQAKGSDNG